MTGIHTYSTTASENVQANTGINWDEGMPPSAVNNSARQNMADIRGRWNDAAWFQYGIGSKSVTATYASSTSITLAGGDATAAWHTGRRVKAVGSSTGTIYGKVSSSSYSSGTTTTTVNFTWDSGSLSNETLTVYLSATAPVTGKPIAPGSVAFLDLLTTDGDWLYNDSGTVVRKTSAQAAAIIATSLASDAISGNKVDGGTISNFASTGITDAASTTVIQTSSSNTVGVCGVGRTDGNLTVYGSGALIAFQVVTGASAAVFYSGTNSLTYVGGESATNAAFYVRKNNTSSRSINASGTVNASNADYAEYENKSDDCGTIAKGQIVGFDSSGNLTDKWSDAISFGVKSTDPSYVGGDVWGNESALGISKPAIPEDQSDEAAMAEYTSSLARFSAALETARAKVDRVAYSGKVPCNVTGASVGEYIIAAQDGDGIKGIAVTTPTLEQRCNVVGRVRKLLDDGRCEIVVLYI